MSSGLCGAGQNLPADVQAHAVQRLVDRLLPVAAEQAVRTF